MDVFGMPETFCYKATKQGGGGLMRNNDGESKSIIGFQEKEKLFQHSAFDSVQYKRNGRFCILKTISMI